MVYLIVPPIIIVLAIAILIVFLSRTISVSSVSEGDNANLTDSTSGSDFIKNRFNRGKQFLNKTKGGATKHIKKSIETTNALRSKIYTKNKSDVTEGILAKHSAENIVSLRKKSMVSDKIADGEDRDEKEVALMKDIEKDPQNSKKYELLGDYYMEHEKFEDARECYKYVLRLEPRHKRAQVAMKNLDRVLQ